MVTIRRLLYSKLNLRCAIMAGADGFDREIRTITSIESPKSVGKLHGGELVLAAGFLFEGKPEEIYIFVESLIKQGIIGLGIKMRFIKHLPSEVIDLANANEFPIFSLPDDMVWSELFTAFHELRIAYSKQEGIFSTTPEAFEALLHSSDWGFEIAQKSLVNSLRIAAVLTNESHSVSVQNQQAGVEEITNYLSKQTRIHDSKPPVGSYHSQKMGDYWITDVVLKSDTHLVLATRESHLYPSEIELLQLLYDNICRKNKGYKSKQGLMNQFIQCVIDDVRTLEVDIVSKHLNLSDKSRNLMLIVRGNCRAEMLTALEQGLRRSKSFENLKMYWVERPEDSMTVVLCSVVLTNQACGLIDALRVALSGVVEAGQPASVYIGNPVQFIGDIHQSYSQALSCMQIAGRGWDVNATVFFQDVEPLYLLEKSGVSFDEIQSLSSSITNFDACKTLEMYLENDSIKKAADMIFIHENTMRYRVSKLQSVLNQDLNSPMIRFNLLIKLKLWRLARSKNGTANEQGK